MRAVPSNKEVGCTQQSGTASIYIILTSARLDVYWELSPSFRSQPSGVAMRKRARGLFY
jgi:hypothetical protein